MQKLILALALALTLTSAFADTGYNTFNYSKTPVLVLNSTTDTNYVTSTQFALGSPFNTGDLYLYAYNSTQNETFYNYTSYFKQIDLKNLQGSGNSSYNFSVQPQTVPILNGYAYIINKINSSIVVNQTNVKTNATLPLLTLYTDPANSTTYPILTGTTATSGNNIWVFYQTGETNISATGFTVGGSVVGSFNVTGNYANNKGFLVDIGDALKNQALALWYNGSNLTEAILDLGSLKVSSTNILLNYTTDFTCLPYVTDKTNYGEVCYKTDPDAAANTSYYLKASNGSLVKFFSVQSNTYNWLSMKGYSQYLAVLTKDTSTTPYNFNYEIWDVSSFSYNKAKTLFLQANDTATSVTPFKIPGAGLYTLQYNLLTNPTNRTNVTIGLLLSGSYITSVLGFLLTIIAGLLLF